MKRAIFLLLASLSLPGVAQAWWNEAWPYRKQVTPDVVTMKGITADDATVLLRLHPGNFDFFFNLREDAGDLRFIGADDRTPLPYHVESYDAAAGVALIWVRVPHVGADMQPFWMYYGNPQADAAASPAESFAPSRMLTLHFAEAGGTPADSSTYGHGVTVSGTTGTPDGVIGRALRFGPSSRLEIAASPVLELGAAGGASLSFWVWLEEPGDAAGVTRLLTQGSADDALALDVVDGRLVLAYTSAGERRALAPTTALALRHWHHVAVILGEAVQLYIDGEPAASAAGAATVASGALGFGAQAGQASFSGLLDEVTVERGALAPAAVNFAAHSQAPDAMAFVLGADESHAGGERFAAYVAMFSSLFATLGPESWVVLCLLALLGLFALDVLVSKAFTLARVERADQRFLQAWTSAAPTALAELHALAAAADTNTRASVLRGLFDAVVRDLPRDAGAAEVRQAGQLEILRANLEADLVRETDALNARMVVLTIAISGGPFLGLLGTVLGVMITFATIAAQGEVNVNTIAPGVAAALTTTVMGLCVAIPSLFGYNFLAGRITRRVSSMEVFAEQVLSRIARALSTSGV